MKLSTHFLLAEFVASAKATARGIDNTPPPELMPRLVLLAEMLERIRAALGAPVIITSGYRCQPLNIAVGGVTSSDHTQGHAADIVAPGFGTPFEIAKLLEPLVSPLGIGQLILEGVRGKQWVHVSTHVPERIANRVITITDAGARSGIQVLS
jgi:zinc D-Ala-D-Ala carboxypeptidase